METKQLEVGDFVDIVANMDTDNPDYTGKFGKITEFNPLCDFTRDAQPYPWRVYFLDPDDIDEYDDFNECEMKKWDDVRTVLWKLSH